MNHRLLVHTILRVATDIVSLGSSALRSRGQLAAENLFLRKQLALYLERQAKPRRADDATRITLVALSRFVEWRRLLTIVKPDTLIRWHRVPALLALDITWTRTSADSSGPAPADRRHGERQIARGARNGLPPNFC